MDHPDYPIGGIHLPSKVFMALTDHVGEPCYGPKSEAALSALIRQWVASTPAAHCAWKDGEEDEEGEEGGKKGAPPNGAAAEASSPQQPASTAPLPSAPAPVASRGYQWKDVFLPNGTELRTIYCGRSAYATVEDEQIISDSGPTTPSRLANRRGCGTRNAWQTVWLRLPGSTRWQRAADCRR